MKKRDDYWNEANFKEYIVFFSLFVVGTCFDGMINQNEQDIDCDGVCRGQYSCHLLGLCSDHSDCKSGWCRLNVCRGEYTLKICESIACKQLSVMTSRELE